MTKDEPSTGPENTKPKAPSTSKKPQNPVSRDLLRARLSDGKWRSISDIAMLIEREISPSDAAQAAAAVPSLAALPMPERIARGRQLLVRKTISQIEAGADFEKAGQRGNLTFRFSKTAEPVVAPGARLPSVVFTRPWPKTKSGLSTRLVIEAVENDPGCTLVQLTRTLEPCVRDDYALKSFGHGRYRGKTRPEHVTRAIYGVDLSGNQFSALFVAKMHAVERFLHGILAHRQLEKKTTVTFFPPEGR